MQKLMCHWEVTLPVLKEQFLTHYQTLAQAQAMSRMFLQHSSNYLRVLNFAFV